MLVAVGVGDPERRHVQLGEAGQRDAGTPDGVDQAVSRRDGDGEDQLLGSTRRVQRQQDVRVQDDTLSLHQVDGAGPQDDLTWTQSDGSETRTSEKFYMVTERGRFWRSIMF